MKFFSGIFKARLDSRGNRQNSDFPSRTWKKGSPGYRTVSLARNPESKELNRLSFLAVNTAEEVALWNLLRHGEVVRSVMNFGRKRTTRGTPSEMTITITIRDAHVSECAEGCCPPLAENATRFMIEEG